MKNSNAVGNERYPDYDTYDGFMHGEDTELGSLPSDCEDGEKNVNDSLDWYEKYYVDWSDGVDVSQERESGEQDE